VTTADTATDTVPASPSVRWARRIVFIGLIALQLAMVARAYWAPHKEFGFQMFSESSQWQAEIVRVTDDGGRVPIDEPWAGYEWQELVRGRGLTAPWRRQHADAGVDNQLELLGEALDWVAANTPADASTRYLEAEVTVWPNLGEPVTVVLRSEERS
jgi:hypothetical protein